MINADVVVVIVENVENVNAMMKVVMMVAKNVVRNSSSVVQDYFKKNFFIILLNLNLYLFSALLICNCEIV